MTGRQRQGERDAIGARAALPARIRAARDLVAAIAALHVVVAVLIGFAHRPVAPAVPVAGVVRLPDGTAAVLCLPGRTDERPPHPGAPAFCDACLITAAPGLMLVPPALASPTLASVRLSDPPVASPSTGADGGRPRARGPPPPTAAA